MLGKAPSEPFALIHLSHWSSLACHFNDTRQHSSVTGETHMKPRMTSPAMSIPGVLESLQTLSKAAADAGASAGLPPNTIDLVSLRASQINGCAVCLDLHARALKKAGETDERLATLAAWREAPYFSDAERAALALGEAATRISDRANPVPDEIWNEAARHFDRPALAALVVAIAAINTWNRLNITTGQIAGEWTAQWVA
jgi:AhpD family alkylhydroperoxidase